MPIKTSTVTLIAAMMSQASCSFPHVPYLTSHLKSFSLCMVQTYTECLTDAKSYVTTNMCRFLFLTWSNMWRLYTYSKGWIHFGNHSRRFTPGITFHATQTFPQEHLSLFCRHLWIWPKQAHCACQTPSHLIFKWIFITHEKLSLTEYMQIK